MFLIWILAFVQMHSFLLEPDNLAEAQMVLAL